MKRRTFISLLVILLVMIGILIVYRSSFDSRFEKYLRKQGYTPEAEYFFKNIDNEEPCNENSNNGCSVENRYFNTKTYTFTKNIVSYQNKVLFDLSMYYDYVNDKTEYTYRITYETGNLIYQGTYEDGEFDCHNEFHYGIDIKNDNYCTDIEDDVLDFKEEATNLIHNSNFLNHIKKQK